MDVFIQFKKINDATIEAKLTEKTGESVFDTKFQIDLKNKTISNYKDFFVELVEQSFLNDVKYNINVNDEHKTLKEDYEKIERLLLQSISVYNDINI